MLKAGGEWSNFELPAGEILNLSFSMKAVGYFLSAALPARIFLTFFAKLPIPSRHIPSLSATGSICLQEVPANMLANTIGSLLASHLLSMAIVAGTDWTGHAVVAAGGKVIRHSPPNPVQKLSGTLFVRRWTITVSMVSPRRRPQRRGTSTSTETLFTSFQDVTWIFLLPR